MLSLREFAERCGLLPTNQESDWLTRQIRAFAEGMGYLLARDKNGASTEVIFPQKESELAYQSELQCYLNQHAYDKASTGYLNSNMRCLHRNFCNSDFGFTMNLAN